jgi:hypothetical protein
MEKPDWFLFKKIKKNLCRLCCRPYNIITIFTFLEGKLEEVDLPCRCVQLCYKECIYGGILAKITIFMFFS